MSCQIVILAGGLGTRLRPMTETVPKPLVSVAGKPFLAHQIQLLANQGFKDFLLLTGYLSGMIQDYFKDGHSCGVRIRYSVEKEILGTAGALKNAQNDLKDTFMLLNGDTLVSMDYSGFLDVFSGNRKQGLVVVTRHPRHRQKANMLVDPRGQIVCNDKNNTSGMNGQDAGVSVFRKNVLRFIPEGRASMEDAVYAPLIRNHELMAYLTEERFYDMGSAEGLKELEAFLA